MGPFIKSLECVIKSISESTIKVKKTITIEYLRKSSYSLTLQFVNHFLLVLAIVKERCQRKNPKCNLPKTSHFSTSWINFINQRRQNQISYTIISFLKMYIKVINKIYTWLICHRTTIISYTEQLKEGVYKNIWDLI